MCSCVEGQTLAERLRRGPLSVEETLKAAKQIAEEPEAAHEKGTVHRQQLVLTRFPIVGLRYRMGN